MKNLENYGVQELDAKEVQSVEGGLFGIDDAIFEGILLVVGIVALVDAVYTSIHEGWNNPK